MSRFGTNWQKLHRETDADTRAFYPPWYWKLTQEERGEAHREANGLPPVYVDPLRGTLLDREVAKLPDNEYNRNYWVSPWKANHEDGYPSWHWRWEKKAGMHAKTNTVVISKLI